MAGGEGIGGGDGGAQAPAVARCARGGAGARGDRGAEPEGTRRGEPDGEVALVLLVEERAASRPAGRHVEVCPGRPQPDGAVFVAADMWWSEAGECESAAVVARAARGEGVLDGAGRCMHGRGRLAKRVAAVAVAR